MLFLLMVFEVSFSAKLLLNCDQIQHWILNMHINFYPCKSRLYKNFAGWRSVKLSRSVLYGCVRVEVTLNFYQRKFILLFNAMVSRCLQHPYVFDYNPRRPSWVACHLLDLTPETVDQYVRDSLYRLSCRFRTCLFIAV